MKLRTIASSIALLAFAGGAFAQVYAGVGILRGSLSVPSYIDTSFGVTDTLSGGETSDTGYKLYGGYNFTQNWGVELGYNDLGSGYSLHGTMTGLPFSVGLKSSNWYLAGTATLPLSSEFALFGKLGWVSNHLEGGSVCVAGNNCGSVDTSNRSQAMFGVGASYAFAKNWAARLEYEDFGRLTPDNAAGEIKASAWSVSIKYSY